MGQLGIIVVYVVALGALMYFFAIKPQKKQQKEQQQLFRDAARQNIRLFDTSHTFISLFCFSQPHFML